MGRVMAEIKFCNLEASHNKIKLSSGRIRSEAVEYSLKLWIILVIFLFYYIFSHMLTVTAIGMQHYRGPFLFYYIFSNILTVTPIGPSANAVTGIVLEQKLPNNRTCS